MEEPEEAGGGQLGVPLVASSRLHGFAIPTITGLDQPGGALGARGTEPPPGKGGHATV